MNATDQRTRILVVDDDPMMRKVLAHIFASDPYTILEADDGATALEKALETLPQLIAADLRMPRMSGLDLLRAARAHPALVHIPVVVFTGVHSATQALECLRHGAAGYFTKPVDGPEFRRRVKSLLGHPLEEPPVTGS
ncbi:MAG: response regulator [Elusimicrobia bacterium]|nr:response regulator [Elusimicrobiota bacterium]